MVCVNGLLVIVGVGLIVTANEAGVPGQALNVGVTVTVPTMVPGALLFVLAGAIHEAICPLPLTAKPICALVFDHPKMAPFGFETNVGGVIVTPGQTTIGLNGPTTATGFTYARTCKGVPAQEDALGVTVYVTMPTEVELLVKAWLIVDEGAAEF